MCGSEILIALLMVGVKELLLHLAPDDSAINTLSTVIECYRMIAIECYRMPSNAIECYRVNAID